MDQTFWLYPGVWLQTLWRWGTFCIFYKYLCIFNVHFICCVFQMCCIFYMPYVLIYIWCILYFQCQVPLSVWRELSRGQHRWAWRERPARLLESTPWWWPLTRGNLLLLYLLLPAIRKLGQKVGRCHGNRRLLALNLWISYHKRSD